MDKNTLVQLVLFSLVIYLFIRQKKVEKEHFGEVAPNQYTDRRDNNDLPSYYRGKGVGTYYEMKREKNTGGEGDAYVTVQTLVSWPDSSGSLVSQIIYSPTGIYGRHSEGDGKWSTRYSLGGPSNLGASDIDSIKTLADVAKKLQEGGTTNPGNLNTLGNLRVGNGATEWGNTIQLLGGARDGGFIDFLNKDGARNTYLQGKPNQLFVGHDLATSGNIRVGIGATEWGNTIQLLGGTRDGGFVDFLNKDGVRNTYLQGKPQQLYTPDNFKADGSVTAGSVTTGPVTAGSVTSDVVTSGSIRIGNVTLSQSPESGGLRITTPSGWTDIGAKNGDWAHIYTDRPRFAFNKRLVDVAGTNTDYLRKGERIEIRGHRGRLDNYGQRCNQGDNARDIGINCDGGIGAGWNVWQLSDASMA